MIQGVQYNAGIKTNEHTANNILPQLTFLQSQTTPTSQLCCVVLPLVDKAHIDCAVKITYMTSVAASVACNKTVWNDTVTKVMKILHPEWILWTFTQKQQKKQHVNIFFVEAFQHTLKQSLICLHWVTCVSPIHIKGSPQSHKPKSCTSNMV